MLIEAMVDFRDIKENVDRKAGDRFEATPERFSQINSTRYGLLAREVEIAPENASEGLGEASEEVPFEQDDPAPRSRRRR